jgi:hypothetical protein
MTVYDDSRVKEILSNNSHLIPLKSIHSTLVYIGKKKSDRRDDKYRSFEGIECIVIIDRYGLSENALALGVQSINISSSTIGVQTISVSKSVNEYANTSLNNMHTKIVPTDAVCQHVTMALKSGINAKDSVQTLLDEKTVHYFDNDNKITLKGIVKRYLF